MILVIGQMSLVEQKQLGIAETQTTLGLRHNNDKEKKIQHRTKKMSNTNPHLNPGMNPDVRQVSCSSLF